jgi:hypothetical protein
MGDGTLTRAIPVVLTDEEIEHALDFIDRMRKDKKEYSVVDRKFDKNNSSYAVNLMGYLGELAAGKLLGVPTDSEVRTGGDAGYDLVYNGQTIQVKTSTTTDLIFNSLSLFKSDIAILVELEGDKTQPHINSVFHVHGFITKEAFKESYVVKNYGYGDRFVVDSAMLSPVTDLIVDNKEEN